MGLFSERYGYIKPSEVIIREEITADIQNAICSCYDRLSALFDNVGFYGGEGIKDLELYLWTHFLNKRQGDFQNGRHYQVVTTKYLEDEDISWFMKLDMVELTINYFYDCSEYDKRYSRVMNDFVRSLNYEFERLNFAYRVVGKEIVEISSKEEINAIEQTLHNNPKNIRLHLSKALELYSERPKGDYRNSIKESISAVEAFCREKTGEDTLGAALNRLEKNGITIPKLLKQAFEKLYAYTNQPDTGIRHALMDDEGTYAPTEDEALFMLVSCSAFINYLNKK